MAPEVWEAESRGKAADIFSLGCVLLEMMIIIRGSEIMTLEQSLINPTSLPAAGDYRTYYENLKHILAWVETLG